MKRNFNFLFLNKKEKDNFVSFVVWCQLWSEMYYFVETVKKSKIKTISLSEIGFLAELSYSVEVNVDITLSSFEDTLLNIKNFLSNDDFAVIGTCFSQKQWFKDMITSIGDELNIQPL